MARKAIAITEFKQDSTLDCGSDICKNLLDYTVGDNVSITANGKVKRLVDENGSMRMSIVLDSVKLGEGESKNKPEAKKFKEETGTSPLMKAMKSMLK